MHYLCCDGQICKIWLQKIDIVISLMIICFLNGSFQDYKFMDEMILKLTGPAERCDLCSFMSNTLQPPGVGSNQSLRSFLLQIGGWLVSFERVAQSWLAFKVIPLIHRVDDKTPHLIWRHETLQCAATKFTHCPTPCLIAIAQERITCINDLS